MGAVPDFPLPIRMAYTDDGSAKANFKRAVDDITNMARSKFQAAGKEIETTLGRSMANLRGGDFRATFDLSGMRQAAAEAGVVAQKLRGAREAAVTLARSTGDTSAETKSYLAALRAQGIEAERAKATADAQVATYSRLQAEIGRASAANDRLAQSYRSVFVEQARAENAAFRSQRDVNIAVSPTLAGSRAVDNGAGFSALAAMAKYEQQAEALRGALDPTIAVQKRFDDELAKADRLLQAGAISTREYAAAQALAKQNLADGWSAITRANTANTAGTVINRRLADSQRDVRMAGIGVGQQLQDIAVSAASSQRASTILAQQLPQLGFALSMLDGNANKTLARLGAVGRVLSGPWGLAVVGAGFVLGSLIDKMLGAEKAAKRTEDAFLSQADKLDVLRNSYGAVIAASRDFSREQDRARESSLDAAKATAAQAAQNIAFALTVRESLKAKLDEALANGGGMATKGYTRDDGTVVKGKENFEVTELRKAIATNIKDLATLRATALDATFNILDDLSRRDTDETYRIREQFKERRKAVAESLDAEIDKRRELNRLRNEERNAIDEVEKTNRANSAAVRETAVFSLPVQGRITSGFGPRSRPKSGASANHPAIDIAAPIGTPVLAPQVGTVKAIGFDKGLGKYVVLDHGAGTTSRFGHLSDNTVVREGELVQKGSVIGKTGNTGVSTGPHLDYQIKINGEPVNPRSGPFPFDPTKVAEAAEQSGKVLQQFGQNASERVARITAEFDRQPRAIDRAAQATRELDKLFVDLSSRDLLDADAASGIQKAFAAIRDFRTRPFQEMVQASREQSEIQRLLTAGRTVDAEVLERGLALLKSQSTVTAEQLGTIRAMVVAQRDATAEQERQSALRQTEASFIDGTRGNVRQGLSEVASGGGIGAAGDVLKRQFGLMRERSLDTLFESVFGEFFTSAKDRALGFDRVKEASRNQAQVADELSATLRRLQSAADGAAGALSIGTPDSVASIIGSTSSAPSTRAWETLITGGRIVGAGATRAANLPGMIVNNAAGNDNDRGDISVVARPPREFFGDAISKIADIFVDPTTARKFGKGLADGLTSQGNGSAYGMLSSGLILGKGGSPLGASIGGSLGEKLGEKVLGKGLESIAKGLGDFAGPLGGIVGGVLGGLAGKLLTSTPRASATIGGDAAGGGLEVVSVRGNSKQLRDASSKSAGEAIDTLDKIAEALGATINEANGIVSIGYRKGKARVDTSGSGITKTSRGAIDFGEDTAAAIKFATMDLIKDGVLEGLRASTQRILQQGTDLDRAIQKATDFESVFTRLKGYTDPVGAALDTLDKEFGRLGAVFKEAGASAAEYADLEKLYGIERTQAIKDAQQRYTSSLKGLLDDLNTGDNGLSLRSRLASAQAAYDPLKAKVLAGDASSYDDFASAAQTLLGISRELNGSQSGYFAVFDEVRTIGQGALDASTAVANASANRDSPFSGSAVPANDNSAVVSAIDAQTRALETMLLQQGLATQQNLAAVVAAIKALGTAPGGLPAFASNF